MKTRTIKNSQSAFALPSVVAIGAFLTIAGCDSANGVSASDAVTNTAQVETTIERIIFGRHPVARPLSAQQRPEVFT